MRQKLNIERAEAKKPNELKARAAQGPLQIVISIDQQKLVLYSHGTAIAESVVSTGVPGHPTPTGVFSIIQKNRWHHSNIYSGAPMPYMQRITWSGVAMHEGVVPGRPASHGCIRLPGAFAQQLWGITKLGVQVVVTRGAITPVEFNHPRLAALTRKSDPLISKQKDERPQPASDSGTPSIAPRVQLQAPVPLHPAGGIKTAAASLTATDASPAEEATSPAIDAPKESAAVSEILEPPYPPALPLEALAPASEQHAQIDTAASETPEPPYPPALPFQALAPASEQPAPTEAAAASDIPEPLYPPALPLEALIQDPVTPTKTAKAPSIAVSDYPPTLVLDVALPQEVALAPATSIPSIEVELPDYPPLLAPDAAVAQEPPAPSETASLNIPAPDYPPQINLDVAAEAPEPTATASVALPATPAALPAVVADSSEGETSSQAAAPTEGTRPDEIRATVEIATVLQPHVRPGPVSVFVSRKDQKLYVRQGFRPIFDGPITIERPELPLGTHIFTAMAVNEDGATMRWSALTLPSPAPKKAEPTPVQPSRKGTKARAVEENHPPANAAQALERVIVPQEMAERIFEHMAPGSSLIVSDQGLGPETGRGTDFIVLTR